MARENFHLCSVVFPFAEFSTVEKCFDGLQAVA
jgi:hypothetical protein